MHVVKQFNLMWQDLTCLDMRSDELIVAGHESGIIYSQNIKGDIKIADLQIHNFHLTSIFQISLPYSQQPKNKFISLSNDYVMALFSFDSDRPLRVMRFNQQFNKILFFNKNEVLAFTNSTIFKIDLFNASLFQENFTGLKQEWNDMIEKRLNKNQYIKKSVQVEEEHNKMFYKFQEFKQLYIQEKGGILNAQIYPLLFMHYLKLPSSIKVYSGLLFKEFECLIQENQTLPITNFVYLQKILEQQDKNGGENSGNKKLKASTKNKKRRFTQNITESINELKYQHIESQKFNRRLKAMEKINKEYKQSGITSSAIQILSQQYHNTMDTLLQKAIQNPNKQNEEFSLLNQSQSNVHLFQKQMTSNSQDSIQRSFSQFRKTEQYVRKVQDLDEIQENQSEVNEKTLQNSYNIREGLEKEDKMQFIKSKFSKFLNDIHIQSQNNQKKLEKSNINTNIKVEEQSKVMLKRQNTVMNLLQRDKQNIENTQQEQVKQQQKAALPAISYQDYTQGLYNLKQKIKTIEERAQTAANLRQQMKISSKSNSQINLNYQQIQENNKQFQKYSSTQSLLSTNIGETQSQKAISIKEDTAIFKYKGLLEQNHNFGSARSRPSTQHNSVSIVNDNNQQEICNYQVLRINATPYQQQRPMTKQGMHSYKSSLINNNQDIQKPATALIDSKTPSCFPIRKSQNYLDKCISISHQKDQFKNIQSKFMMTLLSPCQPGYKSRRISNDIEVEQVDDSRKQIMIEEQSKNDSFSSYKYDNYSTKYKPKVLIKKDNRIQVQPREITLKIKDSKQPIQQIKSQIQIHKMDKPTNDNKDYQKALKNILNIYDKGSKSAKRLDILAQKASLTQGDKLKMSKSKSSSPLHEKEANSGDGGDKGSSDNDDENEDDGMLNEEQRSLIVEEILKADDDDFVLEDNSPSPTKVEEEGKSPSLKGGKQSLKRLVIKSEKDQSKEIKIKKLEEAYKLRSYNLHMQNEHQKAQMAGKQGLQVDFLKAQKMNLTKVGRKEKQGQQQYYLQKEMMRDRVSIKREKNGFRIIIPKSFKYGKADLKNMDVEEFANNYHSYRITIKDIIKMIREQEGLAQSDYLTKEQVAVFLKKNLSKLLIPEDDVDSLTKDQNFKDATQRMEMAKLRKEQRAKDKQRRKVTKEQELLKKKEHIGVEKDVSRRRRMEIEEEKRLKQQNAALYKTVGGSQDGGSIKDGSLEGTSRSHRDNNQKNAPKSKEKSGGGVQMVFATEVQIQVKQDVNTRIQQLRQEREMQKKKAEMRAIEVYVKEKIVKGILMANVFKYIREKETYLKQERDKKEQELLDEKRRLQNKGYNVQSSYKYQGTINLDGNKDANWKTRNSVLSGGDSKGSKDSLGSDLEDDKDNSSQVKQNIRRINKKGSLNNIENEQIDEEDEEEIDKFKTDLNSSKYLKEQKNIKELITNDEQKVIQLKSKLSTKAIGSSKQLEIIAEKPYDNLGASFKKSQHQRYQSTSQRKVTLESQQSSDGYYEEEESPLFQRNGSSPTLSNKLAQKVSLRSKQSDSNVLLKKQSQSAGLRGEYDMNSYGEEEEEDEDEPVTQSLQLNKQQSKQNSLSVSPMGRQIILNSPRRISIIEHQNQLKFKRNMNGDDKMQPTTPTINLIAIGGGKGQEGSEQDQGKIQKLLEHIEQQVQNEDDIEMTEQEAERFDRELLYQRILEQITEKMISKKLSQFKKELLIRIALLIETMESGDLKQLEKLLEKYELNDPEVKQQIISLFQEKYQIDLSTDLQQMIQDQINRVKEETKGAQNRRNIKQLLLKKLRMLNMIAKFCKIGEQNEIMRQNEQASRLLKDLLDQDEFDFYNEDNGKIEEFQENMNDLLQSLFQNEEVVIANQLMNFKKNYQMKFSMQPEYAIREDLEFENSYGRDFQAYQRIQAFLHNDVKLKQVLQKWMHPYSMVIEDETFSVSLSKKKKKYLYSNCDIFSDGNFFDTFFDLAQELMSRLHKVRTRIKKNDRLLGKEGTWMSSMNKSDKEALGIIHEQANSDDEAKNKRNKLRFKNVGLSELMARRKSMSELEIMERQYSALRIGEHLETNFMNIKQEDLGEEDEFGLKKIHVHNILDLVIPQKVIERESIGILRKEKHGNDPLLKVMAAAYDKFMLQKKAINSLL